MKSSYRLGSLLTLILCCALVAAYPTHGQSPVNRALDVGDTGQVYGVKFSRPLFPSPFGGERAFPATNSSLPPVLIDGHYSLLDLLTQQAAQAVGGRIVFASNRDGQTQIYLMNADGSGQMKLTSGVGNDDSPRWSPGSAAILFQSDRDHLDTGYNDIYVMSAGGTGLARLTTDPQDDSSAAWSPDGNRVVFQSLRNGTFYQIYSMNADGTNQHNLSNSGSNDLQPSWSPDGSKIAFASERDHAGSASVYVMNADGSQQTRLTWSDAPFRDEQPVWSPDGTRLAFTSTRDSLVESWQETDEDGGVVQRSAVRTNREVYVMNADGSNQVRLTNGLGNDDSPYWSPDGSRIIFRSDREQDCCDPTSQVWVMNADGTGQANLSSNQFGDYSSSWAPGGKPLPTDEATTGQANQVTIDFNNLPANSTVTNQYLPHVTFSGNGFSAGSNPPFGSDVIGRLLNPFAPPQIGIISRNTYQAQWEGDAANANLFVDFKVPVNNLSFYVLNTHGSGLTSAEIQYWVNWQYAGTWYLRGTGGYWNAGPPVFVNFAIVPQITGLKIIPSGNQDIAGNNYPFIYDDFTFTPDLNVNITNPRVSGNIQGQTKKALIGADVTLQAAANRSGGTYSWDIAGPKQIVSTSADGKTLVVRWTETGTYKVTSSYKLNGVTTSSDVDVEVVIPKLSSFVATQAPDRVAMWEQCKGLMVFTYSPWYTLGCLQAPPENPNQEYGMVFKAEASIPNDTYLSDPAQSGVKFVQLVSGLRKKYSLGNVRCRTARASENDSTTGWQLDSDDPYRLESVKRFSAGNVINAVETDTPTHYLGEGFMVGPDDPVLAYAEYDAFYAEDQFEMYVVYFTGNNPGAPLFQRPLALASAGSDPNNRVAYLPWKMHASALFGRHSDFSTSCPSGNYQNGFCLNSFNQAGLIAARSKAGTTPYSGKVQDLSYERCSWGSPSQLIVDVPRFFVRQQYKDFLGRDPIPADVIGLDNWRGEITRCGFDMNCVRGMRVNVAKAFFFADEFIGKVPGLNAANRGADSYNREFVRQCYYRFLKRSRDPETDDPTGFKFWVDKLNAQFPVFGDAAYNEMIKAFIESEEYRNRSDFPPLPVPNVE